MTTPARCGCGDDITLQWPACPRCGWCAIGCCMCDVAERAPTWPLAPVRCAAPEPVALCPVVHTGRPWVLFGGLRCDHARGFALIRYIDWRDAQPTCAPSRGRCGR